MTLQELKRIKHWIIYLDSQEKHKLLYKEFRMCKWQGKYCYSPTECTYSSSSSESDMGAYGVGYKYIKWEEISHLFNNSEEFIYLN